MRNQQSESGEIMKDAIPNCRAFSGDSAGFYPRPGIFYESPLLPRRPSVMASWADQLCGHLGFLPAAASGVYDRPLCAGPLSTPPGPSHEKASQVVWLASSFEMPLLWQ